MDIFCQCSDVTHEQHFSWCGRSIKSREMSNSSLVFEILKLYAQWNTEWNGNTEYRSHQISYFQSYLDVYIGNVVLFGTDLQWNATHSNYKIQTFILIGLNILSKYNFGCLFRNWNIFEHNSKEINRKK